MDGDDWTQAFLAVELGAHVSADVHELFAVARATMLYGWFYYPLYTLGQEQLGRVAEAAARRCYRDLGGPRAHPTFGRCVKDLAAWGAIAPEGFRRWEAIRRLRNVAAHPARATVMPPGQVLAVLQATAGDVDELFRRTAGLVTRQSGS